MTLENFLIWYFFLTLALLIIGARLLIAGMSAMINKKIEWFMLNKKKILQSAASGIGIKEMIGLIGQEVAPDIAGAIKKAIKGGLT